MGRRERQSGPADSGSVGLYDHRAAAQFVQVEVPDETADDIGRRPGIVLRKSEHHNSGMGSDGPSQVTEAAIERKDHASSGDSGRHGLRVGHAREPFVPYRVDVVAGRSDRFRHRLGQVLVDLHPHCEAARGRMSSRASSAAYARAAGTARAGRVGYSRTISASLIPLARQSSTTLTGIRVPANRTWPWTTLGSAVMASRQSCTHAAGFDHRRPG